MPLAALRELLATGPTTPALSEIGLALAVGAGRIAAALAGVALFAEGGRKDGSIDLVE